MIGSPVGMLERLRVRCRTHRVDEGVVCHVAAHRTTRLLCLVIPLFGMLGAGR